MPFFASAKISVSRSKAETIVKLASGAQSKLGHKNAIKHKNRGIA
jgi:hypothetical protein